MKFLEIALVLFLFCTASTSTPFAGNSLIESDTALVYNIVNGSITTVTFSFSGNQFGFNILGFELPVRNNYKLLNSYDYRGTRTDITWDVFGTVNKIQINWIVSNSSLAQLRPFQDNNVPDSAWRRHSGINAPIDPFKNSNSYNMLFISGFSFSNQSNQEIYLRLVPSTAVYQSAGSNTYVNYDSNYVDYYVVFKRNSSDPKVLNAIDITLLICIIDSTYSIIAKYADYVSAPQSIDFSNGVYYSQSEFMTGYSRIDIGQDNPTNLTISFLLNPWS